MLMICQIVLHALPQLLYVVSTRSKSIAEVEDKLNTDLEYAHQWLTANKLALNKDKTEYMVIGSRQKLINTERAPEIKLGGTSTKNVKQSKTLRIIIDNQLLWNKQIDGILAKVSKSIDFLRRIGKLVPKYTLTYMTCLWKLIVQVSVVLRKTVGGSD